MGGDPNDVTFKGLDDADAEVREFERHRKDFIEIMRELRKKHPNIDMKELEEMAELEAMNRGPKSRAFYRIQATRKLTGGGNVIKKAKLKGHEEEAVVVDKVDDHLTRVFFEPAHYTVSMIILYILSKICKKISPEEGICFSECLNSFLLV